jgi:hypothetical protein
MTEETAISVYHGPFVIPTIADSLLCQRASAITLLKRRWNALVTLEDLWIIEGPDRDDPKALRTTAYLWTPSYIRKVFDGEFEIAETVATLHTYGFYGFFKPSLAEVLAFAPPNFGDYDAVSLRGPESADDLNRNKAATDAGYHVGEATYYKKVPGAS